MSDSSCDSCKNADIHYVPSDNCRGVKFGEAIGFEECSKWEKREGDERFEELKTAALIMYSTLLLIAAVPDGVSSAQDEIDDILNTVEGKFKKLGIDV